ncbi:MAG: neutral/alkaline non-lysosomal ceramidase N-terminal domain-containing protein [Bryobacteraceae bacterium]
MRGLAGWMAAVCCLAPAWAETLEAGASAIEITPPAGFEMWGAAGRKGFAEGALDPLYARTLVLKSGARSVALVTLDLGRTFSREQMDRVRQKALAKTGIQHVIFTASHTHTGPNILDDAFITTAQQRWEPEALERVVRGIETAYRKRAPARLGVGLGASYVGYNRQDGPVRILSKNLTRIRTSPQDPIVTVLRVDGPAGKPIAILVNYAAHPVILNHVTRFSADFPGAMSAYVEKRIGATCLFAQGACGDINTHQVAAGGLVSEAVRTGYELGRVVERVAGDIRTREGSGLQIAEDEMTFPNRWDLGKLKRLGALPTYHQWLATGRPIGYPPETIRAPVTTLLVNGMLAMVTMPGEPYVDLQIDLRERLPEVHTMLLGYANGYLGYLPTIRAAARDGVSYGANAWPTVVAVGAPERMLDRGVIRVLEFLGKLKPKEERHDEAE